MGSGVILLVIVAMWAIVLVPTLLRRHDNATETRSVDRFATAMRILSRRTPDVPAAREIVMPARPAAARAAVVSPPLPAAPSRWRITHVFADSRPSMPGVSPSGGWSEPAGRLAPPIGRASLAVRRRRMLLGLAALVAVTLLIALVAGGAMWGVATFLAVVLVGYLAHLRVETRRAAALARRRRAAARRTAPAADGRAGWATVDAAAASAAVDGRPDGSWDPVDVPLPTYVTKPPAPQRSAEPAAGIWVDGLLDEGGAAADDGVPAEDLEAILDRRAVGD